MRSSRSKAVEVAKSQESRANRVATPAAARLRRCDREGGSVMQVRLGMLVLVLVLLGACGSSSPSPGPTPMPTPTPTPTPTPAPNTVTIPQGASGRGSNAYAPNPLTVAVGTTVTWTNTDTIAHTATSNSGVFDSGSISPGGGFSFRFQNAGSFNYRCTFHPGMVGVVQVQ